MGVKGLQYFMEHCCPECCVTVNLRDMARRHLSSDNTTSPTLVVDGMACLRHWYSCKDWVCGGQWKEYMSILSSWIERFASAGIKLVFFFDGVVEEKKRCEWVKRRQRVNGEVSKIFRYIKLNGEQPGKSLFCLPSGLATFTRFALRSLGQKVFCSVKEADNEIACYARRHGCMGILGQDSDFLIYDSSPYLSVAKLHLDRLNTVLYDRQRLCRAIGLYVSQLPLLACLMGNDVVPQEQMHAIRNNAMAEYRKKYVGAPEEHMVFAVSEFVNTLWSREEKDMGLIPQSLNLPAADRFLLEKGICSYLLPGQDTLERDDTPPLTSGLDFEKYVSPEILKACREQHVSAEGFMVYNVVCEGLVECSNSLEDEEENELPPQAVVYQPCRQHIYGLLLLNRGDETGPEELPAVREWFVYPGNPLKEPHMVQPIHVSFPCERPSLHVLWFGSGPDISTLRLTSLFSIFDCQEVAELHGVVEDSLLAALCLVTYIALQVPSLCSEDVDAYLSQAVCLSVKSPQELERIKLPFLCTRAIQLGSLYVRGLSHLLGANCASGCPLPSAAFMPWHSFDGRLFHSKYLLAHSSTEENVLLDNHQPSLSLFIQLREKLVEVCKKRNRVLQSQPRPNRPDQSNRTQYRDGHRGVNDNWRERGAATAGRWSESRQSSGGNSRETAQQRQGYRRGGRGPYLHSHFHPPSINVNTSSPPEQTHSRWHPSRGRHQLAPRWGQPTGHGAQAHPDRESGGAGD